MFKDDREGDRNVDDDNFIDDTGADPGFYDRYEEPHSPGSAPQVDNLFSYLCFSKIFLKSYPLGLITLSLQKVFKTSSRMLEIEISNECFFNFSSSFHVISSYFVLVIVDNFL